MLQEDDEVYTPSIVVITINVQDLLALNTQHSALVSHIAAVEGFSQHLIPRKHTFSEA